MWACRRGAAVAFLLLLVVEAGAQRIGLDAIHGCSEAHNFANGTHYDELRDLLASEGAEIVPLTSFLEHDLAELDAVVLMQPYMQPFSSAEIAALHAFVATRGSIVIHSDGGRGSDDHVGNLDKLAQPFGVRFDPLPSHGQGHTIAGFEEHPLTEDVQTMVVDYQRGFAAIEPPATDLTSGGDRDDVLAVSSLPGQLGAAVFVGDTSCWRDSDMGGDANIADGDNRQLLANIRDFITCATAREVYCTAKTTSAGCVPEVSFSGCSSAAQDTGFVVTCRNVMNQKAGLLLYSVAGRAAVPFRGGLLCLAVPVHRTPTLHSGGHLPPIMDCSGAYRIDMNAFAAGANGGDPIPELRAPGTLVTCQFWARDPFDPHGTLLSDAGEYAVRE